jgi:hypothetical protein
MKNNVVLFAVADKMQTHLVRCRAKCDAAYAVMLKGCKTKGMSTHEAARCAARAWLSAMPALDGTSNIKAYVALIAIAMADEREILLNQREIGSMMYAAQTALVVEKMERDSVKKGGRPSASKSTISE